MKLEQLFQVHKKYFNILKYVLKNVPVQEDDGHGGLPRPAHRQALEAAAARRENRERETTLLLHDAMAGRRPGGLAGLSVEEIAGLGWMVENLLHRVRDAIERLQGKGPPQGQEAPSSSAVTAALQLQPPQVGGLPLVPYGGHGDVMMQAPPPPHPQAAWLMEVARAGGDLGALVYSGFGGGRGSFGAGGAAAAGTSNSAAAGADMPPPQLGNMGAGFAWTDPAGLPFPPM